ncbi:lantibiotic immunity ABC transporter MutE/EpiE family permease subunit [Vagococcus vulneris]|uniref:Lantibiotic ABC transporter permease n=1 Tax=Vagococcus vulneris TaxID=1977869 RepID=A0A429ZZE3_9ENTE|nr:lantibiotic immunity ABC transporter MutE/EpiE family permease subunit [Vagococcus vulneris]RST99371.1 hypothetical protein CBF37_05215 [Vagococcus vulneris]
MKQIWQSEFLKTKHSPIRYLTIILPLITCVLAVFLMSGQAVQIGTMNWWYTLILPVVVIIISTESIIEEKAMNFFNLFIIPVSLRRSWLVKIGICSILLLISNMILFIAVTVLGIIFSSQFSVLTGLLSCVVMTVTSIWLIPLSLFLVVKWNRLVTWFIVICLTTVGGLQPVVGSFWWFLPATITSRLMSALIKINPNGIPLSSGSLLNRTSVIIPGLMISIISFIVISILTAYWFEKRKEKLYE